MRALITICLLSIVGLLQTAAADSQASKAEQGVSDAHKAFDRAYMSKDIAALEKMMAEDYVGIWGDGSVKTKQKELNDLKSGKYELLAVDYVEPVRARHFGKAAVAFGRVVVKEKFDGESKDSGSPTSWVFSSTWVKKGRSWQICAFQSTEYKVTK